MEKLMNFVFKHPILAFLIQAVLVVFLIILPVAVALMFVAKLIFFS